MSKTSVLLALPVLNEEAQLVKSVRLLMDFVKNYEDLHWDIVIVDNGSTDRTLFLAKNLCEAFHGLRHISLKQKGRGNALNVAWSNSEADILSYMDIDLSSELGAFPVLIKSLAGGEFDLAIGSRLLPQSNTTRSLRRELISRIYNKLVKLAFNTRFSDAQCGFKAISRNAAMKLLPRIENKAWFFDTELLVWAEKLGFRIADVPVKWTEDLDSRVKIVSTAIEDIKGIIRVRRNLRKAGGIIPIRK